MSIHSLFAYLVLTLTAFNAFADVQITLVDKDSKPIPGVAVKALVYGKSTSIEGDDTGLPTIVTKMKVQEGANYISNAKGQIISTFTKNFKGSYGSLFNKVKAEAIAFSPGLYSYSDNGSSTPILLNKANAQRVFACQLLTPKSSTANVLFDQGDRVSVRWSAASTKVQLNCKASLSGTEVLNLVKEQRDLAEQNEETVPVIK